MIAKRIAVTVVVAAALFGGLASGLLVKHRELRKVAMELVRLDIDVLVGG